MQTIEETLFANRKTKEKNARSTYPRTPLAFISLERKNGDRYFKTNIPIS
jgi:hypothetical protein